MKKRLIFLLIMPLLAVSFLIIIHFKSNNYLFLNKEWINQDKKMIEEILPILYEIPDINSLINKYGFNTLYPPHKKELGLGYSITNFIRYGATTNVNVTVWTNEDNVTINSILNIKSNNKMMKILDEKYNLSIINQSELMYSENEAVIRYKYKNIDLYEKYINDYYNYFQINNNNINIPEEIKNEYEILYNASIYGYKVGFGHVTLKERIALEKILEINDISILLSIIPSTSPEARMYAIEGLFKNRADDILNDNDYTDILNKIIELNCDVTIGRDVIYYGKKINSKEDIYNLINCIIMD
jgi:hypothetical protein